MSDYDDTLGYSYWRANELGFDEFDEHHGSSQQGAQDNSKTNMDDSEIEEKYGGHTYYFNEMVFNWDDSRDWFSFSKQSIFPSERDAAKIEEVGAHPDKLEDEVGAHPKQAAGITSGGDKGSVNGKTGSSSAAEVQPSREFTKCTSAIPFIHKHACVTVSDHDTHVHLTSATKQEINILYNGLYDIFNEMDINTDSDSDTDNAPQNIQNAAMDIVKQIFLYLYAV